MQFKPENYLDPKWRLLLQKNLKAASTIKLFELVGNYIKLEKKIYPDVRNIFTSLSLCQPEDINIVIIGQDPYHGNGQANGLAFSVNEGIKIPPSLRNIFSELESDLSIPIHKNGNLESWAKQGVLLLNTCLTVEESKPGSHQNIGWEEFTDAILQNIGYKGSVVFMLWGAKAQAKESIIYKDNNLIINIIWKN